MGLAQLANEYHAAEDFHEQYLAQIQSNDAFDGADMETLLAQID